MHVLAKMEVMASKETGEYSYENGIVGGFSMGTLAAPLRIVPADKFSENSPPFKAEIKRSGQWHYFGAAWMNHHEESGQDYFSVALSHPMWCRSELRLAAWPPADDADDGMWALVWKPLKSQTSDASVSSANA